MVAGLSLGQSGVYAVVRLLDLLSRAPLSEAQADLNVSTNDRPWFDLTYQLLGIGFGLVPVALVLLLLSRDRLLRSGGSIPPVLRRLGIAGGRIAWRDLGRGSLLFLVIGVGTLGVYAAGRGLGLTAQINTDNLASQWWTVPVLVLAAVKNGLLEEVLLMGYFRIRLHALGWSPWTVIVALAVLRGSYHLYQGVGPFVGNVAMGLIFGWCALRWEGTLAPQGAASGRARVALLPAAAGSDTGRGMGRGMSRGTGASTGSFSGTATGPGSAIMPFVWAHIIIDVVGFLAPGLLRLVDPLT